MLGMLLTISVPERVRVSQHRPSRGIRFPGEYPPPPCRHTSNYLAVLQTLETFGLAFFTEHLADKKVPKVSTH